VTTEQALYLIRSTLLTLNDANRSGNYTVLRDLAAPDFQARNTAADLSQSFSDLRHRNFDLYGAALLAPQFTAVLKHDQRGFLHLAGFFPTHPQQIDFDLLFQEGRQPMAALRHFDFYAASDVRWAVSGITLFCVVMPVLVAGSHVLDAL
jgi:hypothetical protein